MEQLGDEDYEIIVLTALHLLGGTASTDQVERLLEKGLLSKVLADHPEQEKDRKSGGITWWNNARLARQHLKEKGELDGSKHGIWTLTEQGRRRLQDMPELWKLTSKLLGLPQEKRSALFAKVVEILRAARKRGLKI